MTDEQLEGWARMLDREPKRKERMAARYSFTGFVPLPARNNAKSLIQRKMRLRGIQ